jgi:hypothetical protein
VRLGRIFTTFLTAGAAPFIGLQVACIAVVWIVIPAALLLDPARMQEHRELFSIGALAGVHFVFALFGLFFAIGFGLPVALLGGLPAYAIFYRLRLRGPVSFAAIGLALGALCAVLIFEVTKNATTYGPRSYVFELFAVLSGLFGWIAFWLMRRPDRDAGIPANPAVSTFS